MQPVVGAAYRVMKHNATTAYVRITGVTAQGYTYTTVERGGRVMGWFSYHKPLTERFKFVQPMVIEDAEFTK